MSSVYFCLCDRQEQESLTCPEEIVSAGSLGSPGENP